MFQIRRQYGCYDEIQEVNGQPVRQCNWVRFVKASTSPHQANVIASIVKGRALYLVDKWVKPNDEIVVLFRDSHSATSSIDVTSSVTRSASATTSPVKSSKERDSVDTDDIPQLPTLESSGSVLDNTDVRHSESEEEEYVNVDEDDDDCGEGEDTSMMMNTDERPDDKGDPRTEDDGEEGSHKNTVERTTKEEGDGEDSKMMSTEGGWLHYYLIM